MSFIKQFLTTNKKPIKKKTNPSLEGLFDIFKTWKNKFDFTTDNDSTDVSYMRIEFNYPLAKDAVTGYIVSNHTDLKLNQGSDFIDVLYKDQFDEKFLQHLDKEGAKLFTKLIGFLGKVNKEYDLVLAKTPKEEYDDIGYDLSEKYIDAMNRFMSENRNFFLLLNNSPAMSGSELVKNIKGAELVKNVDNNWPKREYYRLKFIAKDPKEYLGLLTDVKQNYAKYIPALRRLGEFIRLGDKSKARNDPFDIMKELQEKYRLDYEFLTETSYNHDLWTELLSLTDYCRLVCQLYDNIDNLIEALGLNREVSSESIKDKLSLEDDKEEKEETSEETETSDEAKDDTKSEEKENSDDKEEDDDSEEKADEEEKDDNEEEKEDDSSEEDVSDDGNDEDTSDDEESQSENDKSDEDETEEEEEERREERRRRTDVRLDVPDQDVQDLAKFLASCLGEDVKEVDILKASDVNRPLYHISMNPQIKHFRPQVSQRTLNTEDRSVPRISTSTCIFGCFNGYQSIISDIQGRERKNFSGLYTVYELPFQYAVKPSPKLLPDVGNSDEYWLTSWKQETAIYTPEIAGEFFIPKTEHVYGSDTGNITLHMYLKVRTTIYLDHEQRLDRGYYYILVKNYDFKLPLKGNTEQINVHPISENEYNKINTLSIMVKKKG